MCCISQLPNNSHETLQSLYFGTKAKNIKTQVNMNDIIRESPDQIANKIFTMAREIDELHARIAKKDSLLLSYATMAR